MLLFCPGFSPFLFNSVGGYAGRWDREGPDKLRRAVSQQSMPWFCLPASPLACYLPFLDPMPSVACSPKTKTSKSPFLPHFLPHCKLLVNGTFTVPELLFSLGTLSLAHQTPNPTWVSSAPSSSLSPRPTYLTALSSGMVHGCINATCPQGTPSFSPNNRPLQEKANILYSILPYLNAWHHHSLRCLN